MDSQELVERYIVLLLGVNENPLPSIWHLHKELFLLSNFKKSLKEDFNFIKHYFGPFSPVLQDTLKSPSYLNEPFEFMDKKIILSSSGKKEYIQMVKEYSKEKEFSLVMSSLELIREIYDKLSPEEFFFLIYDTFPDYVKFSEISDRLLKNEGVRKRIIKNIFSKGIITEERYRELENGQ